MRSLRIAALGFLLLAPGFAARVEAFGDEPRRAGYLLAVANTAGSNGTYWKTDVWIHNGGESTAVVAFYMLPAGRAGEPAPRGQVRIEPGETSEIPNLLGTVMRSPDASGAVEFRVLEGPDVFLQWRTSSGAPTDPTLDAVELSEAASSALPARLEGFRRSVAFRSNLALANPLAETVTATVEILDADGKTLATRKVALEPRSWMQLTDPLAPFGRIRDVTLVVQPEGEGRLFALGSLVSTDSGSSEPIRPTVAGR